MTQPLKINQLESLKTHMVHLGHTVKHVLKMVKQSFQCMNQQLMIALHMNYFLGGIQTTQMLQVPTMVTVELY